MKRVILSSFFVFSFFVFQWQAFAQIPEGYYNSIDGKRNSELKSALHRILKEHTVLDYNNLWYYFRTTDVKSDGYIVWDMYSSIEREFNPIRGRSTYGMDREHSLPKSWWATSDEVENYDAYSDLNHLFPSDGEANQAKSNNMLGITQNQLDFDNGVTKVGRNAYPSAPTRTVFEPADMYKGDFARIYMYMVTCYEDYARQWRAEALYMFNKELHPVLQPWAKNMLLDWHRNDPVSDKELIRNEEVFYYQNNRNPFIDLPQLAEYIWGDSTSYTFELSDEHVAKKPILITPVNLTDLYFGEIQKNSEVSTKILLKGIDLRGQISILLWGGNSNYFTIAANSVPADFANSEEGYALEIFYNPEEYGEHNTTLIIQDGGMEGSSVIYLKGICSVNGTSALTPPVGAQLPDIYVQNGAINFRVYAPGDKVFIYNAIGKLVYSGNGSGEWQEFTPTQSGVYVVRINGNARKIIL